MKKIETILNNKFAEIYGRHCNPIWAREELAYLVYYKHSDQYNALSEDDKQVVIYYFDALVKLHGGK